jgi:hypothetical protein
MIISIQNKTAHTLVGKVDINGCYSDSRIDVADGYVYLGQSKVGEKSRPIFLK